MLVLKICPESAHLSSTLLPLWSKPPSALTCVIAAVLTGPPPLPLPTSVGFQHSSSDAPVKADSQPRGGFASQSCALSGDIFGHHSRRELLASAKQRLLRFYSALSEQLFGPKWSPLRLRKPVLKPVTSCHSLLRRPPMAPSFTNTREPSNGAGDLHGQVASQL